MTTTGEPGVDFLPGPPSRTPAELRMTAAERAERDHWIHLCNVAICLTTVAWPTEAAAPSRSGRIVSMSRRWLDRAS